MQLILHLILIDYLHRTRLPRNLQVAMEGRHEIDQDQKDDGTNYQVVRRRYL